MSEEIVAELVPDKRPTTAPPKPKRKRRTKAEIEAGTALVVAPAEVDPLREELEAYALAAKAKLHVIATVAIETQEEMDELGEWQREAFENVKKITERRLRITRPMDASKTEVMNQFKPVLGFWTALEKGCKERIAAFRLAVQAEQDAALKAVQASGGDADASTLVVAHGANVLELPPTSSERVTFKWTVTDANAIPEQYWQRVLDQAKITLDVDRGGFSTDIPGIRIEREVTIVNKAVRG